MEKHIRKFDNFVNEAYVSKEKMKQVQTEIKEAYPEYKFSIKKKHYSTVDIAILSGPLELITKNNKKPEDYGYRYEQVNPFWIEEHYKDSPEISEFLQGVVSIANKGNHNNSDLMTDYHDVGFYINLSIGDWDKPYVVDESRVGKSKPKPKLKPEPEIEKPDLGKSYIDSNGNLMSFESFKNKNK